MPRGVDALELRFDGGERGPQVGVLGPAALDELEEREQVALLDGLALHLLRLRLLVHAVEAERLVVGVERGPERAEAQRARLARLHAGPALHLRHLRLCEREPHSRVQSPKRRTHMVLISG